MLAGGAVDRGVDILVAVAVPGREHLERRIDGGDTP